MENLTELQEQQFAGYYNEYSADAVRYVNWKISNLHDAEDLVEEAFIYCYNHFNDYDPEKSAFRTWLYIVIDSRIKNYYRDHKQNIDLSELENVIPDLPEMEKAVYLEQVRACISRALQELPELQRKIVILKFFMNKTSNEIASALGLTPGNVRVLLSRTLKKMQDSCAELKEGLD